MSGQSVESMDLTKDIVNFYHAREDKRAVELLKQQPIQVQQSIFVNLAYAGLFGIAFKLLDTLSLPAQGKILETSQFASLLVLRSDIASKDDYDTCRGACVTGLLNFVERHPAWRQKSIYESGAKEAFANGGPRAPKQRIERMKAEFVALECLHLSQTGQKDSQRTKVQELIDFISRQTGLAKERSLVVAADWLGTNAVGTERDALRKMVKKQPKEVRKKWHPTILRWSREEIKVLAAGNSVAAKSCERSDRKPVAAEASRPVFGG